MNAEPHADYFEQALRDMAAVVDRPTTTAATGITTVLAAGDSKEVRIAAARDRARRAYLRIAHGAGPEAPKTENALGGRQSAKQWRFDLRDPGAEFVLARVLDHGSREYGDDNWRLIPATSHLNAAQMHLTAYLGGDRRDDHLGHALCRTHMALAVALADENYDYRQADEREVPNDRHATGREVSLAHPGG